MHSIHGSFCPGEQLSDPLPQGPGFRGVLGAVGVNPLGRGGLCLLQRRQIAAQVSHPESRQAGLPGAEEIAGAPEL